MSGSRWRGSGRRRCGARCGRYSRLGRGDPVASARADRRQPAAVRAAGRAGGPTWPRRCCRRACAACRGTTCAATAIRCWRWRRSPTPSRHTGACYAAAGFTPVGATAGYGRVRGGRLVHGQPKTYWLRPLHRRALAALTGCFDSPLAHATRSRPVVDINTVPVDGDGGLWRRWPVRPTTATPAGSAMTRRAAGGRDRRGAIGRRRVRRDRRLRRRRPQPALARLGIRHRQRGRYVAPSHPTLCRTLHAVDTDQLDTVVSAWLWRQVHAGTVTAAGAAWPGPRPHHALRRAAAPVHPDRRPPTRRRVAPQRASPDRPQWTPKSGRATGPTDTGRPRAVAADERGPVLGILPLGARSQVQGHGGCADW